jgi:hypothetical protein
VTRSLSIRAAAQRLAWHLPAYIVFPLAALSVRSAVDAQDSNNALHVPSDSGFVEIMAPRRMRTNRNETVRVVVTGRGSQPNRPVAVSLASSGFVVGPTLKTEDSWSWSVAPAASVKKRLVLTFDGLKFASEAGSRALRGRGIQKTETEIAFDIQLLDRFGLAPIDRAVTLLVGVAVAISWSHSVIRFRRRRAAPPDASDL